MESLFEPSELEQKIGEAVKILRLQQNLTREVLCERADVSMTALRHLESGMGSTIKTLVRVIKMLGREDWLLGLAPRVTINPLHMVRNHPIRQRASRRKKTIK